MRRHEKEIASFAEIEQILRQEKVCRLALSHHDEPYLVPLSYGYADRTLYFHSAAEGKKIAILRANPRLCFEVERQIEVVGAPLPCNWGMRFETVVGTGQAEFIEDEAEKKAALGIIMAHYGAGDTDDLPPEACRKVAVFKVRIESVSGKRSGF